MNLFTLVPIVNCLKKFIYLTSHIIHYKTHFKNVLNKIHFKLVLCTKLAVWYENSEI